MKKIVLCIFVALCVILTGCELKNSHTHSFKNEWAYDNESHWHQAECCEDIITDRNSHEFDEGTIINPTFDEEGYIIYKCVTCGYQKQEEIAKLTHSYSSDYSYDDIYHWNACLDEGYEDLKNNLQEHIDSNEQIIKPVTSTETGLAQYTCSVCNHTYEKSILIGVSIISLPTINNELVYVGQSLKDITLVGGEGSVPGRFEWTNKEEKITESKEYSISFIPNDNSKYSVFIDDIYIQATQLTITIETSGNGTCNLNGTVNVDYGSDLIIEFKPDSLYQVGNAFVDGTEIINNTSYTFENITSSHTLFVEFIEKEISDDLSFEVIYQSGTENAYTIDGNTLYFNNLTCDSVYQISGELNGNIVIDVGEDFKLDLELLGFTLKSDTINPIQILSGNEISITTKKGYNNYIYDNRTEVSSDDETTYCATIYSMVDLEICGKGQLSIESKNNNGIHSKDDLQIKNLTLEVKACDNCLKGNDGVSLENASVTLISTKGDCIKSTNSHINENTLKQKGTVSITGGVYNLYAACDGIDSSYDIVIDDPTTILNIYTDSYSQYSDEITEVSSNVYYIRYSKNNYSFSVKYYNSETDYKWVNADYYTSVNGNRSTYYFYKFEKLSSYSKMNVYMYNSTQTQGQDTSYYACTSNISLNDNYDTLELSSRQGNITVNWNNYSSSGASGGAGGFGQNEGNSDKLSYSAKGLKSANAIIINNGNVSIKAYDDAIHANNETVLENNETALGNVTINGGIITIFSNDDGIHADGNLIINDGKISIDNSYEGIEGVFITVAGGSVKIISKDDGMNSTATASQGITISGGDLYIYATGDGIDSNSTTSYGAILFSGGTTLVICNSNGNSAIDSEKGYSYTGGIVLALTTSGGMSSESTNCSSFSSVGSSSSVSLSSGNYLVVSVNSVTKAVVKMPCSMSALAIFLGSNQASFKTATSVTEILNENGVFYN